MTNRPIPRRGLLGAWFLSDRGITYDSGANEAIDRSGKGNHATYQNGVTVGVEGDPEREFGAAAFDAGSNQFASTNLAPDTTEFAYLAIAKRETDEIQGYVSSNTGGAPDNAVIRKSNATNQFIFVDSNGEQQSLTSGGEGVNDYKLYMGAVKDGTAVFYVGSRLREALETVGAQTLLGKVDLANDRGNTLNGEMAAAAVYDLTVPNAPEPSEIARRWDRLTDIPATR